jgi:histidinol dehydrogenase
MQLYEGYEAAREALRKANAQRAFGAQPETEATVRDICESVRRDGDAALLRLEREFSCAMLEREDLRVSARRDRCGMVEYSRRRQTRPRARRVQHRGISPQAAQQRLVHHFGRRRFPGDNAIPPSNA